MKKRNFYNFSPLPLNSDKEKQYLAALAKGDVDARNKLIEHNVRLVAHIAHKFANTGIPIDELISIGSIGLIKAIDSFNPKKNVKLGTYVAKCVENEILMLLRRNSKIRCEISLQEEIDRDWDGNPFTLEHVLNNDDTGIEDVIDNDFEEQVLTEIFKIMEGLETREQLIIKLRNGFQGRIFNQRETADIMGISQPYICRLEKKIYSEIKKHLFQHHDVLGNDNIKRKQRLDS